MGSRFRRSVDTVTGIRLNPSKSGVSASVGVKGAHVAVGHGQVRDTVGTPSAGVSYTHLESRHKADEDAPGQGQAPIVPTHRHEVGLLLRTGLVWLFVHMLLTHAGRP